ncbi:hypothetical protein PR048_025955 [Dryococelus australis]|uniref:Uncharacterized protein n=1 Tax=Dryococelus australis TaxID=614101 RepID=A0ABQ9GJZ7_9NEOP|nr:hypothetical protein PR048_025955 [Dryococelus australis]
MSLFGRHSGLEHTQPLEIRERFAERLPPLPGDVRTISLCPKHEAKGPTNTILHEPSLRPGHTPNPALTGRPTGSNPASAPPENVSILFQTRRVLARSGWKAVSGGAEKTKGRGVNTVPCPLKSRCFRRSGNRLRGIPILAAAIWSSSRHLSILASLGLLLPVALSRVARAQDPTPVTILPICHSPPEETVCQCCAAIIHAARRGDGRRCNLWPHRTREATEAKRPSYNLDLQQKKKKCRTARWRAGRTTRLQPRRTGFDSRPGSPPERGHWSAGSLGDLPFPPLLHSVSTPHSPRFNLVGSHELDGKSLANISTPAQPMRVKRGEYEAPAERNSKGEREIPRKPADQRHSPARSHCGPCID